MTPRTLSWDEVRQKHIDAMGEPLGSLFTALSSELIHLGGRWQQYSELYGAGQQRFDLMNDTAPFFFGTVQQMLWEETLLAITRLTAPTATGAKEADSGPRQNLTIRRFEKLIADSTLRTAVKTRVDALIVRAAFTEDWRNRRLAHRDLDLSLDRGAQPFPAAEVEDVDGVLEDLASLLNFIESHYLDGSTTLYCGLPITGSAISLLHIVREGVRRGVLRDERHEKGDYRPDRFEEINDPL
jgi:hypothetical protein